MDWRDKHSAGVIFIKKATGQGRSVQRGKLQDKGGEYREESYRTREERTERKATGQGRREQRG
jgi:hypothetical protein